MVAEDDDELLQLLLQGTALDVPHIMNHSRSFSALDSHFLNSNFEFNSIKHTAKSECDFDELDIFSTDFQHRSISNESVIEPMQLLSPSNIHQSNESTLLQTGSYTSYTESTKQRATSQPNYFNHTLSNTSTTLPPSPFLDSIFEFSTPNTSNSTSPYLTTTNQFPSHYVSPIVENIPVWDDFVHPEFNYSNNMIPLNDTLKPNSVSPYYNSYDAVSNCSNNPSLNVPMFIITDECDETLVDTPVNHLESTFRESNESALRGRQNTNVKGSRSVSPYATLFPQDQHQRRSSVSSTKSETYDTPLPIQISINNKKAFKCPYPSCPKTFTRPFNYKSHYLADHTPHKPFACQFCSRGFVRKCDLKRHLKSLHGGKCVCLRCKEECGDTGLLKMHIRMNGECDLYYRKNAPQIWCD